MLRSIWRSFQTIVFTALGLAVLCVSAVLYLIWAAPQLVVVLLFALVLLRVSWRLAGLHQVQVGADEAVIVERWGKPYAALYQGRYTLPVGALVRRRYQLALGVYQGNETEVWCGDNERLRLRSQFKLHISKPQQFHYRGRRARRRMHDLHAQVLEEVLSGFNINDLWNSPPMLQRELVRQINQRLRDWGLQATQYRIEEVIWSDTNDRWLRNRSQGALTGAEPYWLTTEESELCLN